MMLSAVVHKDELVALLDSLTPLRLVTEKRTVTLGRPRAELVAGAGVRLRGDARIDWDLGGVAIPVTVQSWQVLLVPRIATRKRSRVLAFDPVVESLDLKLVPGFFGDKIADAIREGIAQKRDRLAWDFARTLSRRFPLSAKIAPPRFFEIAATDGTVTVTETELRLTVTFQARIERSSASDAKRPVEAPSSVRAAHR